MAELRMDEAVISWSGFPGAPGYSVWHASSGGFGVLDHIANFYQAVHTYFPAAVKISFPAGGRTLDATTGLQVDSWTTTQLGPVQGVTANPYAAPTGARVKFNTHTIWRSRFVHGSTFLVPLLASCFAVDGSLDEAARVAIQTAAQDLVAASGGSLVVWARPNPASTHTEKGGYIAPITSAVVPDKAAILSKRRP